MAITLNSVLINNDLIIKAFWSVCCSSLVDVSLTVGGEKKKNIILPENTVRCKMTCGVFLFL